MICSPERISRLARKRGTPPPTRLALSDRAFATELAVTPVPTIGCSAEYAVLQGVLWARLVSNSDLSRVKRYVTPCENARSACKSAQCDVTGSKPSFTELARVSREFGQTERLSSLFRMAFARRDRRPAALMLDTARKRRIAGASHDRCSARGGWLECCFEVLELAAHAATTCSQSSNTLSSRSRSGLCCRAWFV